ncbi:MAG: HigA family addiction module antidote protein [Bacteroidia bacterium]|nr:HigA family addiction module antidote protein [Bacteroidia bacterium]
MERANETNIHPGIILKEDVIEANGLSIGMAAAFLGVSRLTLSKIANGKGSITPNIALRLEKAFGGNADFWLRMQRGYDLIEEKIKFEINPPNVKRFEYRT